MNTDSLQNFRVFAFTHKSLPLEVIGKFHIEDDLRASVLWRVKKFLGLKEVMYLSTCNRIELLFVQSAENPPVSIALMIDAFGLNITESERALILNGTEVHQADEAVKHLFKVSASLNSMVIGEREIITQVRKSYDEAVEMNLSGDFLRIVIRKAVETAKEIFTQTAIFKKPVSIVSLAFRRLQVLNAPVSSRIVIIGAGKTNRSMAKFLVKHGYKNIVVYNRSLEKAKSLVEEMCCGEAMALSEIGNHSKGFDVLLTCTSATQPIITSEIYSQLCSGESSRKIVIDLALPGDVAPEIFAKSENLIHHINIEELRDTANKNMLERSKEVEHCEEIIDRCLLTFHDAYKTRQIEVAMRQIPDKVKEIKDMAINTIYAKELATLDNESREVLNKVLAYLEKKYISVPMKMAKEVMMNHKS